MSHPPIILNGPPEIAKTLVAPFTHTITLSSGPWTCTARLELPGLALTITPARTPRHYVLGVGSPIRSTAEVFDLNLSTFMGAVSTAAHAHYAYSPVAVHHLLQGMAQAMTYFGIQYGYLRMVNGDTVEATAQREDA